MEKKMKRERGMKELPTAERIRELFCYDPTSGILTRRISVSNAKAGSVAGSRGGEYLTVSIDGSTYRVHRVVFVWMTGAWPPIDIDHRDLDKFNNRWLNLRPSNKTETQANQTCRKNNAAGTKGVYWNIAKKKWVAQLRKEGQRFHLGYFDEIEVAKIVYAAKAKELFGEFARVA